MDLNALSIYFGIGFIVFAIIFGILAAIQRDRPLRRRLYVNGFVLLLLVGVVFLLRETKLFYLESFAKQLL